MQTIQCTTITNMFQWRRLRPATKAMFVIVSLTLLAYGPSLGNEFQAHDDTLLITRNPTAQGLTFTNIKQAFTTFDPELYIPLTLLTYQTEYSLFGLEPFVFHLTNLLLHIGSALLIFLIAKRLAKDRPNHALLIAFATASVFALHPLNTETVAWAAARKDVLSSFLFFASLWAYLESDDSKKLYRLSIGFFVLGLMAKVSIIVLPAMLLLLDNLRGRRDGSVQRIAPFCIPAGVFGLIAIFGKQLQITELTLLQNVLLWCKSAAFYLQKLLFPQGLTIIYNEDSVPMLSDPSFFLPVALVAALILVAALLYRRRTIISTAVAWYLIALLPSFATFWKNGFLFTASDRYAYIATVAVIFAAMYLVLPKLPYAKHVVGALVAVLLVLTMRQSLTWKDTKTLYERSIALNARPVLQLNNLGTHYADTGDLETARKLYDNALEYDQRIPQTLANIAKILRKQGKPTEAAEWFERSINMIPDERMLLEEDLTGYFFLGEYHDLRGNTEEAIAMFEAAADRAPQYALPQLNLGIMYQKYGRVHDAKDVLEKAVAIQGDLLDARYRLAALQAETGDIAGAIENLEYVVRKDPAYQQAAKHLESLYRISGIRS